MADWDEEEKQYTPKTVAHYWFQPRKARGIALWCRTSDLRFNQNLSLAVPFLDLAEQTIKAERNMGKSGDWTNDCVNF